MSLIIGFVLMSLLFDINFSSQHFSIYICIKYFIHTFSFMPFVSFDLSIGMTRADKLLCVGCPHRAGLASESFGNTLGVCFW